MTCTPKWSTACLDWRERIVNGESLIPFAPLFPEEADRALDIFKSLKIKDIPGHPTFGEVSRQWVFDLVAAVFGSYDPENGVRLINEFFVCVAKKNTKSTLAAGIMLTADILNWRESNELLILAPTVEVAANSFDPAMNMIKLDEELDDMMHIQEHYRKITHLNTDTKMKVIAAEKESAAGNKAGYILTDELWLFGKRPNAENMLREATGGLASRPEGFKIWLTTHSDEAPVGIYKKKLEYARGVRDGEIDDKSFLPLIYEYPEDFIKKKKYLKRKYWYIPNPNLGLSVSETFIEREMKQAEIDGEESMQGFLAKHLNIEIKTTQKVKTWVGATFWDATAERITIYDIINLCDVIEMGVDGGGLDDLLGLGIVGRVAGTKNWMSWAKAWAHEIALERRKINITSYQKFKEDGDLVIVSDMETAFIQAVDVIEICHNSGLLDRVGFDAHGSKGIYEEAISRETGGIKLFDEKAFVGIPQGYRLNGAIIDAEGKLADKKWKHADQPMMAWCVGNAMCTVKGNNNYITKEASGSGKIDPFVATLNAIELMRQDPEPRMVKSNLNNMTEDEIKEHILGL